MTGLSDAAKMACEVAECKGSELAALCILAHSANGHFVSTSLSTHQETPAEANDECNLRVCKGGVSF